jgi:beta-glucanase (GH16 family)
LKHIVSTIKHQYLMEKFISKTVGLLLIIITLCSCHSSERVLSWKENFSGKELNNKIWSRIPRGKSDWNKYMTSFDSCYGIRHGKLILKGIRNYSQTNDTAHYLTGGVFTKNKKTFGVGRIEVRAKLGSSTGAWPAIWMLPENAKWPIGGEIDIMERLNYDKIAYQTVHSYYIEVLKNYDNPKHGSKSSIKPNKYNVYAVEIHPDSLVFFINDKRTFVYPRIPEAEAKKQFVFTDQPFYILIDMQLGGSWVGKVNPEELPVQMQIDWVKYYTFKKR